MVPANMRSPLGAVPRVFVGTVLVGTLVSWALRVAYQRGAASRQVRVPDGVPVPAASAVSLANQTAHGPQKATTSELANMMGHNSAHCWAFRKRAGVARMSGSRPPSRRRRAPVVPGCLR